MTIAGRKSVPVWHKNLLSKNNDKTELLLSVKFGLTYLFSERQIKNFTELEFKMSSDKKESNDERKKKRYVISNNGC